MKSRTLADLDFKKIVDWHVKNEFIESQVSLLEGSKDHPIIAISCFLLKSQLIEFELKQLIFSLDSHLYFSTRSLADLKRKTRTPKDLDNDKLTLGRLEKEINKFEGKFLQELKTELGELVSLRNHFVHKLFNLGSLNELLTNAETGLKLANKTIESIRSVNRYLEEHNPLDIAEKDET